MLTRRQFAVGSATIIGAGVLSSGQAGKADALDFRTPLPIPKLIDAAKEGNSVRLKAASSRHSFFNAKPAPTYGYSASLLGPVIRLRRGDEVEMVVENMLGCDTTVHWHGLAVPGAFDGGPQTSRLEQPKYGRCFRSAWRIPSIFMAHRSASFRSATRRRPPTSWAGRMSCLSKKRLNFLSPSIGRRQRNAPSCITATSSSTKMLA
jgi:FtsP/CotA-like multicopper oxidase with cupredoxin domain